jgi:hypothetical protein
MSKKTAFEAVIKVPLSFLNLVYDEIEFNNPSVMQVISRKDLVANSGLKEYITKALTAELQHLEIEVDVVPDIKVEKFFKKEIAEAKKAGKRKKLVTEEL